MLSASTIIISTLFGLGLISHSIAVLCECGDNAGKTGGICKQKVYFRKIGDIFIACFIILFCFMFMRIPIDYLHDVISHQNQIGLLEIRRILGLFLVSLIVCFGAGGGYAGFLSVFQSNLTWLKRVILLIICLLPLVCAILCFIISPSNDIWLLIKLGIMYSGLCWIANGPSIILGKHWLELSSILLHKIYLNKKGQIK